ncbi:MAG TPA: AgmX/PglI C-terminal domain-containing protein [Kofleriaceae bacterium]
MKWILIVGVLAACGGKKQDAGAGSAAPAAKHGELVAVIGECGAVGTTFVSGPPSRSAGKLAFADDHKASPPHPGDGIGDFGYGSGGFAKAGSGATAQGDLDKAVIRRYIKRSIPKFQACYTKQLAAKPKLAGTVKTQFFIDPTGKVTTVKASGLDPTVASCIGDVIKTIEFPKPKGGGGVQVNYPFTFQTDGPGTTLPSNMTSTAHDESGGSGTAMALDEGKMGKDDARQQAIDQARQAGILGTANTGSAIAPIAGALSACATKQPLAYGAFAIEWKGTGTADVIGVDDKAFAACISDAAKQIASASPMRCGVSFGSVPDKDRHAIAIDATDVKLDGNVVDHVATVGSTKTISALGDSFDKHLPKIAATTVAVRGPVWLKPAAATSMAVVNTILKAAAAANVDLVLADASGTSLVDVKPPVPPVDAAKPGSWTGMMPIAATDASEAVVLSITINKDDMFIGISRINEFTEVKGRDWADLEAKLTENKKSAFFSDHTEIEIGGADDATYDDVLHAIAVAKKVGFTSWKVYPADQLTAAPSL